jgi:hypothetical protein
MAATARVQYDYGTPTLDAYGDVHTGNKRDQYAYGGSLDAARKEMGYGAQQAEAWDAAAPNGRQMIDTTRADAARRDVYAGVDEMMRGQQFAQQQAEGRAPSGAAMRYGQSQEAAALEQARLQSAGPPGAAQAAGMAQATGMGAQYGGARAAETAAARGAYGAGGQALRGTAMRQGDTELGMQQAEVGMQYGARGLTDQMSEFYRRQRAQAGFNQMQGERFASQEQQHWANRAHETAAAATRAKQEQVAGAIQAGAGAVEMATSYGTKGYDKVASGAGRV